MEELHIGDSLKIHCYKHNGMVHCCWSRYLVLDIKKDYIVVGNRYSYVTEEDGRVWKTKEPAILYFFKNHWFNIVAQLKKDGISYYCNIASPYIIEEGVIKYIDYDLDVRIYPSSKYRILDRMEYKCHKQQMKYSDELDCAIHNGLNDLLQLYRKGATIFQETTNLNYYDILKKLENQEN